MIPLKVAIIAAFLFNRYKFLSRIEDKNLYRLAKRTLYALRSGAADRYQGPHIWTSLGRMLSPCKASNRSSKHDLKKRHNDVVFQQI
ncbi:hypothetical protein RBB83_12930 [Paenibacillus peoriae]|uniref:hypothetical protein n=1 Tax=Paenibacillus peoriae TaxID=59893 RepID=UPI0030CE4C33